MVTELGKFLRKIRIDNNELLLDMAQTLNVSSAFHHLSHSRSSQGFDNLRGGFHGYEAVEVLFDNRICPNSVHNNLHNVRRVSR